MYFTNYRKEKTNLHNYHKKSEGISSKSIIEVSEKAREDRKYQNDYLQRHTCKKNGEKKKEKEEERGEAAFEAIRKIRNRTYYQIRREQLGRRARTGQTTFSTLQGACNFYRRDASRRCLGASAANSNYDRL